MKPKFITDFQTRINETMSSIKAIKGEQFAEATHCLFKGTHATNNLYALLINTDMEESVRTKVMDQITHALSAHMSLVVNLMKAPEQDINEMLNWVDVLHKHVNTAIEEAS